MSVNMSLAREVGQEAILTIPPQVATTMWDHALQLAPTIEPWVGCEGRLDRLPPLLDAASDVAALIPPHIHSQAQEFVAVGNKYGALVVDGFTPPQSARELIPKTPDFPAESPIARAAGVMALASATLFGPPITYSTNPKGPIGKIITSVASIPDGPTPLSSAIGLGWHVEVSDSFLRPDVLSLFGIRGDKRAITGILPVQYILAGLDTATIDVLSEPRFLQPDGLAANGDRNQLPMLRPLNGRVGLTLDWRYELANCAADPDDRVAVDAIRSLRRILTSSLPVTAHCLRSGQVLAIDNHGPHCRTAFTDKTLPANPRWMLRVLTGSQRHIDRGTPIVDPTIS